MHPAQSRRRVGPSSRCDTIIVEEDAAIDGLLGGEGAAVPTPQPSTPSQVVVRRVVQGPSTTAGTAQEEEEDGAEEAIPVADVDRPPRPRLVVSEGQQEELRKHPGHSTPPSMSSSEGTAMVTTPPRNSGLVPTPHRSAPKPSFPSPQRHRLQRSVPGSSSRGEGKGRQTVSTSTALTKIAAVVVIQAAWRGFSTREHFHRWAEARLRQAEELQADHYNYRVGRGPSLAAHVEFVRTEERLKRRRGEAHAVVMGAERRALQQKRRSAHRQQLEEQAAKSRACEGGFARALRSYNGIAARVNAVAGADSKRAASSSSARPSLLRPANAAADGAKAQPSAVPARRQFTGSATAAQAGRSTLPTVLDRGSLTPRLARWHEEHLSRAKQRWAAEGRTRLLGDDWIVAED